MRSLRDRDGDMMAMVKPSSDSLALVERDKMRNEGEESRQPVDPESTVCQPATANESRLLSLSASHSHTRLVLLSNQGVNVSWTDPNKMYV